MIHYLLICITNCTLHLVTSDHVIRIRLLTISMLPSVAMTDGCLLRLSLSSLILHLTEWKQHIEMTDVCKCQKGFYTFSCATYTLANHSQHFSDVWNKLHPLEFNDLGYLLTSDLHSNYRKTGKPKGIIRCSNQNGNYKSSS